MKFKDILTMTYVTIGGKSYEEIIEKIRDFCIEHDVTVEQMSFHEDEMKAHVKFS